jgi:hypothetical protein
VSEVPFADTLLRRRRYRSASLLEGHFLGKVRQTHGDLLVGDGNAQDQVWDQGPLLRWGEFLKKKLCDSRACLDGVSEKAVGRALGGGIVSVSCLKTDRDAKVIYVRFEEPDEGGESLLGHQDGNGRDTECF